MAKKWDWGYPEGRPEQGRPTRFKQLLDDGYEIELTLQPNDDGVIVCSGISIQFLESKSKAPRVSINSRYFQLLGLGEALSTAREAYSEWAGIIEGVYNEMEIEASLKDWSLLGNQGFPDTKYAEVAYMYLKFVSQGLENPVSALADSFGGDKNTWSSRVLEARNRGLLTKPKSGNFGGKLTIKSEKLLPITSEKRVRK